MTRTVRIPGSDQHAGHHLITVTVRWECPRCGGPRGDVATGDQLRRRPATVLRRVDKPVRTRRPVPRRPGGGRAMSSMDERRHVARWIRRRWSCRMTPPIVEPALRCYLRERCR